MNLAPCLASRFKAKFAKLEKAKADLEAAQSQGGGSANLEDIVAKDKEIDALKCDLAAATANAAGFGCSSRGTCGVPSC